MDNPNEFKDTTDTRFAALWGLGYGVLTCAVLFGLYAGISYTFFSLFNATEFWGRLFCSFLAFIALVLCCLVIFISVNATMERSKQEQQQRQEQEAARRPLPHQPPDEDDEADHEIALMYGSEMAFARNGYSTPPAAPATPQRCDHEAPTPLCPACDAVPTETTTTVTPVLPDAGEMVLEAVEDDSQNGGSNEPRTLSPWETEPTVESAAPSDPPPEPTTSWRNVPGPLDDVAPPADAPADSPTTTD